MYGYGLATTAGRASRRATPSSSDTETRQRFWRWYCPSRFHLSPCRSGLVHSAPSIPSAPLSFLSITARCRSAVKFGRSPGPLHQPLQALPSRSPVHLPKQTSSLVRWHCVIRSHLCLTFGPWCGRGHAQELDESAERHWCLQQGSPPGGVRRRNLRAQISKARAMSSSAFSSRRHARRSGLGRRGGRCPRSKEHVLLLLTRIGRRRRGRRSRPSRCLLSDLFNQCDCCQSPCRHRHTACLPVVPIQACSARASLKRRNFLIASSDLPLSQCSQNHRLIRPCAISSLNEICLHNLSIFR